MLKVLSMQSYFRYKDVPAEVLFEKNLSFTFLVEAPLYWWIDFDCGLKFGFNLSEFSELDKKHVPMSTNVRAYVCLSYQEIVEICENYIEGVYEYTDKSYQWPNEREWKDFCETLLDVHGIRDLVQEEI